MSALPVVYEFRGGSPAIDIVSIPGLPDLVPEYRIKDHNKWIRDVLSHQTPLARIMSFHYDFAKISATASWKDLLDQTLHFLFALSHRRERQMEMRRPIVFICYSFGSIILKKALLVAAQEAEFRQIFDNTVGILFLGSLHTEDHVDFEESSLRCAAIEFNTTSKKPDVIERLRASTGWTPLKETLCSFRDLNPRIDVRSFCETKASVYQVSRWTATKRLAVVCPEPLAILGWPNEQLIRVELDHTQLSKFPIRSDPFFDVFMKSIKEVILSHGPYEQQISFSASNEPCQFTGMIAHKYFSLAKFEVTLPSPGSTGPDSVDVSNITSRLSSMYQDQVKIPCFVSTPYEENPNFMGRDDILIDIDLNFQPLASTVSSDWQSEQFTYALCGLGGIGKTQIALRYIFANRDLFPIILWANADSRAKLVASFVLFAKELGLHLNAMGDQAAEIINNFLAFTKVKWLMVFDNLDSDDKPDLVRDFLPDAKGGAVLFTSRDSSILQQFGGTDVMEFDESEAVKLLKKLTKSNDHGPSHSSENEDNAAKEIVRQIGYFPLGIQQCANLILQDMCSFVEFLEGYNNEDIIRDSQRTRVVLGRQSDQYPHSLRTVWEMNFERLFEGAQVLLNVISFGDPDSFPLWVISNATKETADDRLNFVDSPKKLYRCKTALLRSSLLKQTAQKDQADIPQQMSSLRSLRMHRLVQSFCHLRMTQEDREYYFNLAITVIKRAWPVNERHAVYQTSLWSLQRLLLPHVQSLCAYYKASCLNNTPLIPADKVNWDFPRLLYDAAWSFWEQSEQSSMPDLLSVAKDYCLSHHENQDHALLADIYGGLGSLYSDTNRQQECFDCFNSQWKCLNTAFDEGQLHRPNIREVFSVGRLGNGLMGLNRYSEAEKYYWQCFEIWNTNNLPGDKLLWKANLTNCLWLQGKLDEGYRLISEAIDEGCDWSSFRPAVAHGAKGNIEKAKAQTLLLQGKVEEAEAMFDKAFMTYMKATNFFREHFPLGRRTGDSYYRLAWILGRKQKYREALSYLDQALEIFGLNPEFKPEYARTLFKRGCIIQDMGQVTEGRNIIEKAESIRKKLVGPAKFSPAVSEESYDELIMFWSR